MPPSSLVLSPGESGIIEVMICPWSQHLFDFFYTTLFSISSLLLSQVLENTNITIICQAEGGRPPAKVELFSIVIVAIMNKIMATTNITVISIIAILTIMFIISPVFMKKKPNNTPGDMAYTRIALNVCPLTHKVFQYLSLIIAVVAVFAIKWKSITS